jgi:transposase InsO family protein
MDFEDLLTPPVHLRPRGIVDHATQKLALRAALTTAHLFGVATGVLLRRLRAMNDPLATALAQAQEAAAKASLLARTVNVLGARFDKLPERRRPFYTPHQRFQILELKNLLGWAADHTAKVFRVCTHTIRNWEANADVQAGTVGSTVRPTPPVTRFADVVRSTVHLIAGLEFGCGETAALVLARAGWKVSARSVRRIMKRSRPRPTPRSEAKHWATHPVIARFVHHVWMMDTTQVQAFLGGSFHVAGVFDAFSRAPLALQTYDHKPGAAAMARLLKTAARAFGKAKYLITDQGKEFDARLFRKTVARLGTRHRFGTVDNIFATARLERFWRSLKETANLKHDQPLTVDDLERRLETTLTYYICFRPHQGLEGRTPAEAFLGIPAPHTVSPPRGRTGEGPAEPPFAVAFVETGNGSFPILKKTA